MLRRAERRTGAWSGGAWKALQKEPRDNEERASRRSGTAEVIVSEGRCEMGVVLAWPLGTARAKWAMGRVMARAG